MENSNEPINPVPYINRDGSIQHDVLIGLTKREYFTGLAMQSMTNFDLGQDYVFADEIAKRSVIMADALLNALSK